MKARPAPSLFAAPPAQPNTQCAHKESCPSPHMPRAGRMKPVGRAIRGRAGKGATARHWASQMWAYPHYSPQHRAVR
jgi:hypothetical protein